MLKSLSVVLLLTGLTSWAEDSASSPTPSSAERLKMRYAPEQLAHVAVADNEPVILLPKFEVQDSRVKLSERDVMSSSELLAQAKARYLSPVYQRTFGRLSAAAGMLANLPSIFAGWHPNNAEASALFAQDERLRRMRDSQELMLLLEKSDPASYKELKQATAATFRHEVPWRLRRVD